MLFLVQTVDRFLDLGHTCQKKNSIFGGDGGGELQLHLNNKKKAFLEPAITHVIRQHPLVWHLDQNCKKMRLGILNKQFDPILNCFLNPGGGAYVPTARSEKYWEWQKINVAQIEYSGRKKRGEGNETSREKRKVSLKMYP